MILCEQNKDNPKNSQEGNALADELAWLLAINAFLGTKGEQCFDEEQMFSLDLYKWNLLWSVLFQLP